MRTRFAAARVPSNAGPIYAASNYIHQPYIPTVNSFPPSRSTVSHCRFLSSSSLSMCSRCGFSYSCFVTYADKIDRNLAVSSARVFPFSLHRTQLLFPFDVLIKSVEREESQVLFFYDRIVIKVKIISYSNPRRNGRQNLPEKR